MPSLQYQRYLISFSYIDDYQESPHRYNASLGEERHEYEDISQ